MTVLGGRQFKRCSWTFYTEIISNVESLITKITILSGARITIKTLVRHYVSKKYSSVVTIPNGSNTNVSV